MKYWQWQKGRQEGTDYEKFPLFSLRIWKWGFDGYILRYAPHTVLDWHIDPVPKGKHWRKNWTLKGFATFLFMRNGRMNSAWRANKFRPDLEEHKLIVYDEGCTKLSLGYVKFD